MTAGSNHGETDNRAERSRLGRRIALGRIRASFALFLEQLLPLLIAPVSILSLFLSAAWLGFFRSLPDWLRWTAVGLLVFFFLVSLLGLRQLKRPGRAEVDRRLEETNGLPHQAISSQQDAPVTDTPFSRALWNAHRQRLAASIRHLEGGWPRPDISRFDPAGLRVVPALALVIAAAFSLSPLSGRVLDAFRNHPAADLSAGSRIDVWITPPGYTARPAITLSADAASARVPQYSMLTVRLSGEGGATPVTFTPKGTDKSVPLAAKEGAGKALGAQPGALSTTFELKLSTDGTVNAEGRTYQIALIPDQPPRITFDGKPRRTVNGALEIRFKAHDDYGLASARADIVPLDQLPQAQPLFPLPEFPLDVASRQGGDVKGISSRNLNDHPLAGKRVRMTLVAIDAAGQTGRSDPLDIVLPARAFSEPLAAAVAEQRQIFSLDVRDLQKAIEYNDAITLRADENIPNPTHFLLIKSARARMVLARDEASLKDAASYLWDIALGIDGGDLPMAERAVRDAQKALADALKRNAPDSEIKALMDELRKAMQNYMSALAKQMQQQKPGQSPNAEARNVIRQQDLEQMMDQLENMARSGNKDAAQKLLNDMQRLMNNLQAGNGQRQPSEAESKARQQVDKLGQILRDQQKLMEDTYKLDQQMQQQEWQQADPGDEGSPMEPMPGEDGQQQQGNGNPTADQKKAMGELEGRQRQLEQQLQELGQGLKGLGMKPNKGLGQAGREMNGAGKALGLGKSEPALKGQGRALEALRKGAQEMMQAMKGQGQGSGAPQAGMPGSSEQSGRDPLGRSRGDGDLGDGSDTKVPDQFDVQRARDILESIRRKLGDTELAPSGRHYLERLLNLD